MKIAIVGRFGAEEVGLHIYETFKRMEHTPYKIQFGPKLNESKNNRNTLKRKIKEKLFNSFLYSKEKIRDYVLKGILKEIVSIQNLELVLCTYDWLSFKEIQFIKEHTGAKIILWFPDGIINLGRCLFMNAGYDSLFFKDPTLVKRLKDVYQMNAYYLPECFDPDSHKKIEFSEKDKEKYECDISFIGNLHANRLPIIEKLIELDKYKIKIYGAKAPFYLKISDKLKKCYTGKYILDIEKSKAIKYSKINLNTVHLGEMDSINVRAFELCGAGGFQMINYRKSLDDLYKINRELVIYETFEELVEKIDYFLENPERRNEIAVKGYERSHLDHTYEIRIDEMLKLL